MGRKKAHKVWRKQWRRAITVLYRNVYTVTRFHAGEAFNAIPADDQITAEVTLFEIADAFETWPDAWAHRCYFAEAVDALCACGMCRHGTQHRLAGRVSPRYFCAVCAKAREQARIADARRMLDDWGRTLIDRGILDNLEMGPPQGDG